MMRVLFVCLGNICRSPSAEAVARHHFPNWEIDSAGTGRWHIGSPPDPRAIEEGKRRGYDLSSLRARHFQSSDFDRFDIIYAMDENNLRNINTLRPCGHKTRVELLLGDASVPDPYYDGRFSHMFDLIEVAIAKWDKS